MTHSPIGKYILVSLVLMFITTTSEAKRYKFKDENYSIKLDKSWKLNQSSENNFAQMFYSGKHQQTLIVRRLPSLVVDGSKLPNTKKEFVTFLNDNYLKAQKNRILDMMKNHFSIKPIEIIGYKSFLANVMSNTKNTPLTLSFSVIHQNDNTGYLFTLVNPGHREITESDIQRVTKNFKVLNIKPKQKKFKLKTTKNIYKSDYYGYQIPYFEDMIPAAPVDLNLNDDEAIVNHIQINGKLGSVFMVSSFCNSGITLNQKKILSFYIDNMDSTDTISPFSILKDDSGEYYAKGKIVDEKIDQIFYYYKVQPIDKCHHTVINFDTKDRGVKPINDFTAQLKPYKKDTALLSEKQKTNNDKTHALVQAAIGKYFNEKGNIISLNFLKQSISLDPNEPAYLDHYLNAANNYKKYSQGLKALEQSQNIISKNPSFSSWKAWFLAQTEDTTQAIKVYKELFAQIYTNDDDFFSYLTLLKSKKKWSDILEEVNNYKDKVSKQKSLELIQASTYASSGQTEKSKKMLATITQAGNFSDYDFFNVLDVYYELKDFKQGLKLIQKHINEDNKDVRSYYYLGDFQYNAGQPKLALKSMQKALEYDPTNKDIQNYITGINSMSGIGDIEITKTPITALKLPKEIQKNIHNLKLKNLSKPVSNYYYITGYNYKKNQLYTKTHFRKYRVNDLQSADGIETLQIKFNQEYEHPYINKFIVKNLSNQVITTLNQDTVYITSINDGISADGDRYLNIPIPSIADNTEVEYIISIQSNDPVNTFNLETDYLVSINPYLYMASFIQGDVNDISSNFSSKVTFSEQKNLKIWKSYEVDLFKQEDYRPESHEIFQWVEMASTEKSWVKAGNSYLEKIKSKLGSNLSKGQLLSILPNSRDPITISKELASFVQSDITYQALEFGARAQIPNTSKQTLANKYGDCKDHAVILYDLLKKKGIDAKLALVNTEEYVNSELVTLDQFNHVVIYLPKVNGGIFIDTTDKYTVIDLKTPPRSIQGSKALILDKNKSKLIDVPNLSINQNTIKIERTVSKKDHLFIFNETALITGYIASGIRSYLQPLNKEHINTEISKWVNAYYPDLTVSSFNYYNLDKLEKPLIIEFQFQQNSNNSDFKVPAFLERVYLTFSAYEKRFYPFKIRESVNIESTTTTSNDSFKLNKSNDNYNSKLLNWSFMGDDSIQNFRATIQQGTYKANEYQSLFNSLKQAVYKVEKSFILTK